MDIIYWNLSIDPELMKMFLYHFTWGVNDVSANQKLSLSVNCLQG